MDIKITQKRYLKILKIAITGSGGFLGNKIYSLLISQNFKINKFKLKNSIDINNFLKEISTNKYDYIINCAASINPKTKHEFFLNEILPKEIQNLTIKFSSILIHISSLNVLNTNLLDHYTKSKFKAENSLKKNNLILIRPSLIINETFQTSRNEFNKYIKLPINNLPMIYPGNIYYPVDLNKLSMFIIEKLNNNNIKYLAFNISGKEKYCLWDIFNQFCQYRNKKAIKINLEFLDTILPIFLKKYFKSNRTLQNLLPISRYSDNFNDGDNITL